MFANVQTLIVVLAAIINTVHGQAVCARNYTIHLGDTCDTISAAQGVSTYQLAFVNQDKIDANCTDLALGEPLCLGVEGQDCSSVHVVASGDSCYTITSAAGINATTLLTNNPNVASGCTNIYPGEVLCTANQNFNYSTPFTS